MYYKQYCAKYQKHSHFAIDVGAVLPFYFPLNFSPSFLRMLRRNLKIFIKISNLSLILGREGSFPSFYETFQMFLISIFVANVRCFLYFLPLCLPFSVQLRSHWFPNFQFRQCKQISLVPFRLLRRWCLIIRQ